MTKARALAALLLILGACRPPDAEREANGLADASTPQMPFEACVVGEKLDAVRYGFQMQKPTVSTRFPVAYAGLRGGATVEHDQDGRIQRCIFQLADRGQQAVRTASERFIEHLRRESWTLVNEARLPNHVAGGDLLTFSRGATCRSVFWGCYLQPDDCAATVSQRTCQP